MASANFAMLLFAGVGFRFLKTFEPTVDTPSTSWAVQAAGLSPVGPGAIGVLFAVLLGLAGAFAALALSKPIAKRLFGARVVREATNEDEAWLLGTVRMLAERYGMRTPEVAIDESPKHRAIGTGLSRNRMLLTLSKGLLQARGRKDVEGMLSFEMSHVANGRLVTFALVQGALNALVVFALLA